MTRSRRRRCSGAIRRVGGQDRQAEDCAVQLFAGELVNSFLDETGIVSLKPARHYVDYVCRLCDALAADFYLPFASQAVFERRDSHWANDYRTSYRRPSAVLAIARSAVAALYDARSDGFHAPFDAARGIPAAWSSREWRNHTSRRVAEEEAGSIVGRGHCRPRAQAERFRWLLWLLFPRGFGFQLGERRLGYDARARSARDSGCRMHRTSAI